jgi:hypothetical protein
MPNKEDKAKNAGKIATTIVGSAASMLSGIPGLNIIAGELYSIVIIPSLDKRRIDWLNDIAKRLVELEKKVNNFKVSDLAKNELFLTVITQATQTAIRSHQEEKLEVLKNVVINSAKPLFADDSLYLMYIQWIDIFTPWHIRILNFLNSPTTITKNGRIDIRLAATYIVDKIDIQFPSNETNIDIITQVLMDLHTRGLIEVQSQEVSSRAFRKALGARITDMGKNFLKYISE